MRKQDISAYTWLYVWSAFMKLGNNTQKVSFALVKSSVAMAVIHS